MSACDLNPGITRRRFLAGAGASAAVTMVNPSLALGADEVRVVRLGLIGCGGRGKWLIPYFLESGKYRFTACADYFEDRAREAGKKAGIPGDRCFTGLMGYRRVLESDVDAVVIETPPFFHPVQASEAVEAGKHVFLAKPIAVDAPGCLTIAEAGTRATAKKLVFLVDFQTRANNHYQEAIKLVRQGAIGAPVLGDARYPWSGGGRGEPPASREDQLRQWYYVKPLSGDFIVEQSIHSLDVASWILDAEPIRAVGFAGRKMRPAGSIMDHFAVTYHLPNDVLLSFTCIQAIPECRDEIRARVYGTKGSIDTDYYSDVEVRGEEFYKGTNPGLYVSGTTDNIRTFHEMILAGKCDNPTVAQSVRSNLYAVLGRDAGYQKGELSWAAMLRKKEKLEFDLKGLKS